MPYRAYVNVDELACGVVANTASFQRHGRVAQQRRWNSGDAEVYGFGDDVLGVFGCIGRPSFAQHVIGFLGAITGEDVDYSIGLSQLGEHGM